MKKSVVKPREYKYTDIKKVETNTTVDVYGVVKFLKHPFKTRGKDYCMVVSLIDQTCKEDEKLKCLLFHSDPNKLPGLSIGDIVRFHRLKISMYNNEEQGQSSPGFAWVVFSGDKDGSMEAKLSCSPNFTFTDADKEKIRDLRSLIESTNADVIRSRAVKLENIIPQMYLDFVCQVVAICFYEEENCLILRVWDGTVTIYQLRQFEFKEELLPQYDLELMNKADGFLVDVALYDEHCNNAKDKIKPGDFIKLTNLHTAIYKTQNTSASDIPTLELVLHRGNSYGRGFSSVEDSCLAEHLSHVGNLRTMKNNTNNKSLASDGTNQGQVITDSQQPSTSKRHHTGDIDIQEKRARKEPLSDESQNNGSNLVSSTCVEERNSQSRPCVQLREEKDIVRKKNKDLSQGIQSSGNRCMQQTVSVIHGHPHINITKIRDVVNGDIPYKYRVLGQVDDFYPNTADVKDFLKLYCNICNYLSDVPQKGQKTTLPIQKNQVGVSYYFCPCCNENATKLQDKNRSVLQYIYMMRFKISDNSGSIIALIWKDEAITFFRGLDPEDLLSSESLWNELQDELTHLCSADKPSIECCVKSYTVGGRTNYQIFDTCLV